MSLNRRFVFLTWSASFALEEGVERDGDGCTRSGSSTKSSGDVGTKGTNRFDNDLHNGQWNSLLVRSVENRPSKASCIAREGELALVLRKNRNTGDRQNWRRLGVEVLFRVDETKHKMSKCYARPIN